MGQIKDLKDEKGLWKRSIFVDGKRLRMRGGEIWNSLVQRCKEGSKTKEELPTYLDVENHFKDFQDFMNWATCQTGYHEGFDLDKDILVKGNRIYSKETCVFVPHEINMFFVLQKKKRGLYPIGVTKRKDCIGFCAQGRINGKTVNLGQYPTPHEAFLVHKKFKEDRAKELAEKWRGRIDPRVYAALYNFDVEITD